MDNDSTSSSETNEEMIANSSGGAAFLILPSAGKPAEILRGIGMIAKVVSDNTGIIWWLRKPNHYKSVWFHRQKTFKYGLNLHDKSLRECVKEGKWVFEIRGKTALYTVLSRINVLGQINMYARKLLKMLYTKCVYSCVPFKRAGPIK